MIAIIVNPRAGGASSRQAEARVREASAWLTASGLSGQIFVTEARGHAHELATGAVARRDELVIAWGGDGTVNEVASALVETGMRLAIIPAGSGNGLARDLRIPSAAAAALEQARAGRVRAIDAGQVDGRWFFSIAGIGFDARVAELFDSESGPRRGMRAYARLTARELVRYRARDYRIDGRTVRRAFLVTFANASQFGNGARIAPDAQLDDGLLDLVVVEERSRLATIANVPRLFTGGVARIRGVSISRIRAATVQADEPMTVHVDGEPVPGGTKVSVVVRSGVLRVVARDGA